MSNPLDKIDDPLVRLELEQMQERSAKRLAKRRQRPSLAEAVERLRQKNPNSPDLAALVDVPEELEPLSPEGRREAFLDFAIAVHLEPGLDEEHAIRAQLEMLREQYLEIARDKSEGLAWLEVLTDEWLAEVAATCARYMADDDDEDGEDDDESD